MGKRNGAGEGDGAAAFVFEFHAPDFHVPQDVQRYTEDKLRAKLHKFARSVERVRVYVRDENGAKHGVDKSVHMDVHVVGLEPVNVAETHQDLRAALDLCIDRVAHTIAHHLEKRATKRMDEGRKKVRRSKLAPNV